MIDLGSSCRDSTCARASASALELETERQCAFVLSHQTVAMRASVLALARHRRTALLRLNRVFLNTTELRTQRINTGLLVKADCLLPSHWVAVGQCSISQRG